MSSSGPPPAAPTFEASKCALIIARAVASVIENPPNTDAAAPGRPSRRGDLTLTLRRRPGDASWLTTRRSVSARPGPSRRQATRGHALRAGDRLAPAYENARRPGVVRPGEGARPCRAGPAPGVCRASVVVLGGLNMRSRDRFAQQARSGSPSKPSGRSARVCLSDLVWLHGWLALACVGRRRVDGTRGMVAWVCDQRYRARVAGSTRPDS